MAGAADRIRLFRIGDSTLAGNLMLGRLPAGTAGVEARLTSGATISGTTDGDLFAVWSPNGSVAGAELTTVS